MIDIKATREKWLTARRLLRPPGTLEEACDEVITLCSMVEEARTDRNRAERELKEARRTAEHKMRMFAEEVEKLVEKWR